MASQLDNIIKAQRFNDLKAKVKAECLRRSYVGSVANYGSSEWDFSIPASADRIIDEDKYKKISIPTRKINWEVTPNGPSDRIINDADLLSFETNITAFKGRAIDNYWDPTDCSLSCTGTCTTSCTTGCGGGCDGGCRGCGGACSSSCSGGCEGGCTSCTGECSGSCSDGCGNGCDGQCTTSCYQDGQTCKWDCTGDCNNSAKGSTCTDGCVGNCKMNCWTQCSSDSGACGGDCKTHTSS